MVMLGELPLTTRRLTVAADKAYGTRAWVAAVRRMHITPHVAQNQFRVRWHRHRRPHDPTRRVSAGHRNVSFH